MRKLEPPPGYRVIFRPYFTHPKPGRTVWAKQYGIKAFPILVKN